MISAAKVALAKLFRTRSRAHEEQSESGMGFFEHLEELRKMMFRCCAAFAISAGVSLYFYKDIFRWLQYPLEKALAMDKAAQLKALAEHPAPAVPVDPEAGWKAVMQLIETGVLPKSAMPLAATSVEHADFHMQILKLVDIYSVLMDVILFGGIALSCPVILLCVANFIGPALSAKEKRMIAPGLIAATLLFFTGALLSFFWLMPISIEFSVGLSRSFGVEFNWTAADYYSFVVMMTLLIGLVFEFPLVIVGLQYFEVTSTRWLFSVWRHAMLAIVVISVVFTPLGDPLSLCVLSGVLFGLYIAAILIGDWLVRLKRRRLKRENPFIDVEDDRRAEDYDN